MKNIFLLPTLATSRLRVNESLKNNLELKEKGSLFFSNTNVNIYITDLELIQEIDDVKGKYVISEYGFVTKADRIERDYLIHENGGSNFLRHYRFIRLCTDYKLIKNGVQEVPNEFLEWFVKNPSCEFVEVESYNFANLQTMNVNYTPIIPTQDQKQEIQLKDPNTCEHFKEVGCIKDVCDCYTLVSKQETIEGVDVSPYQELFNFFSQEHNLTLLNEEMDEVIYQCDQLKAKFNKSVEHQSEKMFSEEETIGFAEWMHSNTVYNGTEYYSVIGHIGHHKLQELLQIYKSQL